VPLSKAQQVFSDRIRSERNESPQISNRLFSKQAKKNLKPGLSLGIFENEQAHSGLLFGKGIQS